jgi:outer membrane protein insertion porin family
MENLTQRVGYTFEYREYENISQDYALILNKNDEYTSKITNGFYYDIRDNNYNPTTGFFVGWDTDLAGLGGNKDYIKNVFRFLYYYPITSSIVFKSEFKAGFIRSINNPLFPSDGFYLGGYSMRGFRSGGIGPRVKRYDGGDVRNSYGIGGTELYYGNFELKLPLGLPKEIEIFGILFLNFGLTTGVEDNPEIRKDLIIDSKNFRSAYGFSIIWQTMMGNIGFDFSKVLKMEYYDISENFRFSIGTRF